MARVEKIICDRCQREATGTEKIILQKVKDRLEVDLCDACFGRISSILYTDLEKQRRGFEI